jgi:hypothetical protein
MVGVVMNSSNIQAASEAQQPQRFVRVYARDEKMAKALAHSPSGMKFRSKLEEGVDWPNDSFTHKMLKQGAVFKSVEDRDEWIAKKKEKDEAEQQRIDELRSKSDARREEREREQKERSKS